MPRMVLLLHELADGSAHFDWMIERARSAAGQKSSVRPDERILATWRVFVRIDDSACREFDAEALDDHRRAYLDFEGELDAGRGRVTRVALGEAEITSDSPRRVDIIGRFARDRTARSWIGVPSGTPGRWRFTVSARPD
ncbi:MAG: hypothetical protein AB7K52_04950 [Phycisphaerales bacterium]